MNSFVEDTFLLKLNRWGFILKTTCSPDSNIQNLKHPVYFTIGLEIYHNYLDPQNRIQATQIDSLTNFIVKTLIRIIKTIIFL